jgi:hypothetical protein
MTGSSFLYFYLVGITDTIISIATGIQFNLFSWGWSTFGSGQEIEVMIVMVSGFIMVGIGRIIQLLETGQIANRNNTIT